MIVRLENVDFWLQTIVIITTEFDWLGGVMIITATEHKIAVSIHTLGYTVNVNNFQQ